MLSQGRDFMGQCWWMIAVPGGAIVLVSLGFNFVGDGLRDLLDPRRGSAGSQ
jgi:peptide/nickel transport system permease protein